MAHRAFGQKIANDEAVPKEPVTFDLGDEKEIRCRDAVNGKLLLELIGKVDSGSVTQQAEGILQVFEVTVQTRDGDDPDHFTGRKLERHSLADIADLEDANADAAEEWDKQPHDQDDEFVGVILGIDPTSSYGRLQRVLDSPDTEIQVEELAELVGWLVEQYTGRPTVSASSSRNGSGSTKPTSRRARRSRAAPGEKVVPIGSST